MVKQLKPIPRGNFLYGTSAGQQFLVVVSENLTGHRMQYLTSLSNRVSKSDTKIIVVLISKVEFELSDSQIQELQGIDFYFIDDCKKSEIALSVAREFAQQNIKSEILFWDADNWISPLLLFRQKSKLLYMRPYLSHKSFKKITLFLLKWSTILFFHYIRRFDIGILGVPLHSQRLLPSLWVDDSLLVSPDLPTSTREKMSLRPFFDISHNSKVVLVPGFITARKNPQLIIEAIELASKSTTANMALIFAGKSDVACSTLISSLGNPNVKQIDRYLSDDDYRSLLRLADVVVLPYTNRGSSGIAIEALANGKPVIIGDSRLWAEAALSTEGQLYLCKLTATSVALALVQIFEENRTYPCHYLVGINRPTVIDFFLSPTSRKG